MGKNKEELPDLEEWLEENSNIAEAIVWEEFGEEAINYTEWDEDQKKDLADIFEKVWNSETIFKEDPIPNNKKLKNDDAIVQALDKSNAWTMFLAYIAQSLMLEIKEELDWSITDYSEKGLFQLFNSSSLFEFDYGSEENEYFIERDTHAMPCEPKTAYNFLVENEILKSDRISTIEALLEWCRTNLLHCSGGIGEVEPYYDQWQYKGLPPIIKVIEGTKTLSEPSAGKRHLTAGCWGTSGFLRIVLWTVNIPVIPTNVGSGHGTPYFVEDGLYLSHGDDPYNQLVINDPPIPISELFIDEKKFEEWFGEDLSEDESSVNVGRIPVELSLKYLPNCLLNDYREDIEEGKSHSEGAVFENYDMQYTVEELEEMGLWKKLDKKLKEIDG